MWGAAEPGPFPFPVLVLVGKKASEFSESLWRAPELPLDAKSSTQHEALFGGAISPRDRSHRTA